MPPSSRPGLAGRVRTARSGGATAATAWAAGAGRGAPSERGTRHGVHHQQASTHGGGAGSAVQRRRRRRAPGSGGGRRRAAEGAHPRHVSHGSRSAVRGHRRRPEPPLSLACHRAKRRARRRWSLRQPQASKPAPPPVRVGGGGPSPSTPRRPPRCASARSSGTQPQPRAAERPATCSRRLRAARPGPSPMPGPAARRRAGASRPPRSSRL